MGTLLLGLALALQDAPSTPPREPVSAAVVQAAGKLAGLSLTDEEAQLMLREVVDSLESFGQLRQLALENSVAPVLTLSPTLQATAARHPHGVRPRPVSRSLPQATRPVQLQDLLWADIPTLASLIRSRQVSCVELTDLFLARLAEIDARLHCVVTLLPERARAQAKALDDELARDEWRGLLHGIPWGAKDLLAVRGAPTTWGAEPYRDQVLDLDAAVVESLDAAGAVLIAKLSLGALAMGDVWFGGTTKNPWNPEQGASGSSAGPASATAAGGVVFAIGSETCGSILSPSARCGVSSLRPTFGRVSRHGAMALSWSMDKLGPMCRSLDDAQIVFTAIQGFDLRDEDTVRWPWVDPGPAPATGLRVGLVEKGFGGGEQEAALVESLEAIGCEVVPVRVPERDAGRMFLVLAAEAAAAFDELTTSGRDDLLTRQSADAWPNLFRAAQLIPAVEYIQANRARRALIEDWEALFDSIDVLVHPASSYLVALNLTGHPSCIAPAESRAGAGPSSVAFTAGLYQEARLLTVGAAWQRQTGFHLVHPIF